MVRARLVKKFPRVVLRDGILRRATIRKGGRKERGVGARGREILLRSFSSVRTNFRRRTFTASAIVSLHPKLDYRPVVIGPPTPPRPKDGDTCSVTSSYQFCFPPSSRDARREIGTKTNPSNDYVSRVSDFALLSGEATTFYYLFANLSRNIIPCTLRSSAFERVETNFRELTASNESICVA